MRKLFMVLLAVSFGTAVAPAASASAYEPAALDTTITFAASDDFWQTTGHVAGATATDDEQLANALDNRWFTAAVSTVVNNFRHFIGMTLFLK